MSRAAGLHGREKILRFPILAWELRRGMVH